MPSDSREDVPPTRRVTLPDGRVVECVSVDWTQDSPDDPPGTIPLDVTVTVDGDLTTIRVLVGADDWPDDEVSGRQSDG